MALFNYAWHYKEGKVTFPLFFFNMKRNVRLFLRNKVDFFPSKSSLGLLRWLSGKNPLPMQEMQEIMGSVPGSGRSPGEGNGNPLQFLAWENPMDRGAWQATAHREAKSQT